MKEEYNEFKRDIEKKVLLFRKHRDDFDKTIINMDRACRIASVRK